MRERPCHSSSSSNSNPHFGALAARQARATKALVVSSYVDKKSALAGVCATSAAGAMCSFSHQESRQGERIHVMRVFSRLHTWASSMHRKIAHRGCLMGGDVGVVEVRMGCLGKWHDRRSNQISYSCSNVLWAGTGGTHFPQTGSGYATERVQVTRSRQLI